MPHVQRRPAARRPAARAHRRADAARRAGGELLVPAPPRRLRVDRRRGARGCASPTSPAARATAPTCSPATRRRGGRRRRQPRGARARPAALPAPEPALRARPGRGLRRAPRRDRLPADDRARRRAGRAAASGSPPRRRSPTSRPRTGSRWRRRGRREVRQPLAPARVHASTSTGSCSSRTSPGSRSSASSTPASCARTSSRPRSAGTGSIPALGITKPFYDRFVPAISARDFRLSDRGRPRPRPSTSSRSAMRDSDRRSASASAIWRSSCTRTCPTSRASAPTRSARSGCSTPSLRSHLPVLEVADAADDDGHPGARRPARGRRASPSACARFVPPLPARRRRGRCARARRGRRRAAACAPRPSATARALERLAELGGDPLAAFGSRARAAGSS